MDDQALIQALQAGERAALRRTMEVYAGYTSAVLGNTLRGQAGPEEQAERREAEERLRALVESMEEPDRTLFLRYYYEEEPLDQVCRDLKMRPSTARSRLCRGRRKLKERLTQEGGMLDAQSHP